MAELPTGTVTFMISDIAGSTRRWADDDMSEALTVHDRLTREAIEANEGTWVKHTGDGVLAAFNQPGAAITAAVDLQRRLADYDWEGKALQVRIGIHTGEATPRDGDYFGLAVSAAARIGDGAHPGQVVLSSATEVLAGDSLDEGISLAELGKHRFKGLRGPITLFQVKAPGLAESFPPIESLIQVEHNLPPRLTTFIGREYELAEVVEIVDSHRLTTLTGVGGAGKTRLSLEAAHALADDFKDGAWFVELAPVNDPAGVASTVAGTLGVRHEEGDPIDVVERLLDHLKTKELLLVFDNCEHVLRTTATLVTRILSTCPNVKVISSSREGLGVSGERIWQTPSLTLGADSDAVALFAQRANDSGSTLELNEGTLPHVERICELLDGMPLAIELAAARCRVLSPAQIEQRLDDRFRLLTGGSSMALPRQQTLEAAVDWSYQLLTGTEQLLFERLSVFQGGFTIEAVESICTDEAIDDIAVLDTLAGLVDKSMVIVQTEATEARYSMLETLRQYSDRKLQDRGETDLWKKRQALWFAEQTDVHNPQRTQDIGTYDWLKAEGANLAAALEWSATSARDLVAPLAEALATHSFGNLGDPAEAVELYELALSHTDHDDPERRGDVLAWLARSLGAVGRVDEGFDRSEAAITVARDNIDEEWAPRVLRTVATWYSFEPEIETDKSLEPAELAVEAARKSGDRTSLQRSLTVLGWTLIWGEETHDRVEAVSREALSLAVGDVREMQRALSPLLLASMTQDALNGTDLTTSVEDEILDLTDGKPTLSNEWYAWTGIRRADWPLTEDSIEVMRTYEKGRNRLNLLIPEAAMAWMRGRLDRATRLLEEAYSLGRIGRWHHDFYPVWADVAACLGQLDRVEELVAEHVGLEIRPAEEQLLLASLRVLVHAQVDAGDQTSAAKTLDRMRAIKERFPRTLTGSVQLGHPLAYYTTAEAELTRLTGPDPVAWEEAQSLHIYEYFKTYCQARRAEALHELGSPEAGEAVSEAIARAEKADAQWILGWLTDHR